MGTDEGCVEMQIDPSIYQLKDQCEDLISSLPEDCIYEIFNRINDRQDWGSCAAVCWGWAKLLLSLSPAIPVTHKTSVELYGPDIDDTNLVRSVIDISSRDLVTHLYINYSSGGSISGPSKPQVSNRGMEFITQVCCNLKEVSLLRCSLITDKGMEAISSNCPALETLDLRNSVVTDEGLCQIFAKCTNLRSLYIEKCPSITGASLQSLAKYAKNLRSLTLAHCPRIPENAIIFFMIKRPGLDELKLENMALGKPSCCPMSHPTPPWKSLKSEASRTLPMVICNEFQMFHRLCSLSLVNCPVLQGLRPQLFTHAHFPWLKCIVIKGCRGLDHIDLIHLVGPTTQLNTLKLSFFRFSSYADLMEVLSLCQETMKYLNLENCSFDQVFSPQPLKAVPQACRRLKVVKLVNCRNIANMFLPWLSMACHNVEDLKLTGMDTVADTIAIRRHLYSVICRCKINMLDLSRSRLVDDDVCLISILGDNLYVLVLDGCSQLLGHFAGPISKSCRKLCKLSLCDTHISDSMLERLVSGGFPNLEELCLDGCSDLTEDALDILCYSEMPSLLRVNVRRSCGITEDVVEVYDHLWNIKYTAESYCSEEQDSSDEQDFLDYEDSSEEEN